MDDEIDDRNERLGHCSLPPSHVHRLMDPSPAIILAAIIIIGGLWGGKLLRLHLGTAHEGRTQRSWPLYAAGNEASRGRIKASAGGVAAALAREEEAREQRQTEQLAQRQADESRIVQ